MFFFFQTCAPYFYIKNISKKKKNKNQLGIIVISCVHLFGRRRSINLAEKSITSFPRRVAHPSIYLAVLPQR
jgi:hypothetical protein